MTNYITTRPKLLYNPNTNIDISFICREVNRGDYLPRKSFNELKVNNNSSPLNESDNSYMLKSINTRRN